jgi:ribosomal protein S27E
MDAVSDHQACRAPGGLQYARHRPEETLLYQIIDDNYADCLARFEAEGRSLPRFVRREFEDYLKCGRLEHGFLRVRCSGCHVEKLVAFSCKRRGFCPSCGARRMVESAALLVDEVLPAVPMRQWVLSVPFALRFLFATNPAAIGAAAADRVPHDHRLHGSKSRADSKRGAVRFGHADPALRQRAEPQCAFSYANSGRGVSERDRATVFQGSEPADDCGTARAGPADQRADRAASGVQGLAGTAGGQQPPDPGAG